MGGAVVKKGRIYEGKAKVVYETDDPSTVIIEFKDDATAFDGKKRGTIGGKGEACAAITARAFEYLESCGIATHYRGWISRREIAARRVRILPVEAVVRNVVAGSLAKRLGLEEGLSLREPVFETYYKSDELGDPMVNDYHILALGLATREEIAVIERMSLEINRHLTEFFDKAGLRLVDFKLEFGVADGDILLADEISPDTCRLWDKESLTKLDKDRFRRDLGGVEEAYQEVVRRVELAHGMAR
ncbi:MAG TPA: phosphoribosylaminoimidazolesuccinocarboxamide synthase [Firmicutes bacterium]|nr:phosphoribosylaminoimidazolesuccinocarboxamide synthase [Bacillota bacterium]